jgi:thymidylate synthase
MASLWFNSEKHFLLNAKNEVLSYESLIQRGDTVADWVRKEIPDDSVLGILDLQHYNQRRSFGVLIFKSVQPAGGTNADPSRMLTISYTFKLKHRFTITLPASASAAQATDPIQVVCLYYTHCDNACCQETPYLNMVRKILTTGESRKDRTGTGTLSIFGHQIRFDIRETVPLLTTKFVPWKSCLHELLWFLRGSTDSRELEAKHVGIWKGNTRRAFLDQRGLTNLPEGDIGAGYGFQWRHFGAEYQNCETDYSGQGTDQIAEVIRQLKEDPFSRRIVLSAWNPASLKDMALPPCHILCQFYVSYPASTSASTNESDFGNLNSATENDNNNHNENTMPWLSCQMYQRSQDVFLGAPFNIFSYTALTYLLAKICKMRPRELIVTTGDTHIYKDHILAMKEQLQRIPLTAPILTVSPSVASKDFKDITVEDFTLDGYFYHPRIYGSMSV